VRFARHCLVYTAVALLPFVGMTTCLGNCHVDGSGVAFIERQEGNSPLPYRDISGIWTVGIGHVIRPGERFSYPFIGEPVVALLKADLAVTERSLNRSLQVPVEQHEFNPLASLAFNEGVGAIGASTTSRTMGWIPARPPRLFIRSHLIAG
jgi:lysozyme